MEYTNLSEEENTQKQPQQMQSIAQPAVTQPQQTITQPQQPAKKMSLSDQIIATSRNVENQRKANIDKYGIELDPVEYSLLDAELERAQDPREEEAIRYKYAAAKQYSKTFNVPLENAFDKVDEYSQAIFAKAPKIKDYEQYKYTMPWYETLCNSWTIGENGLKLGDLGMQLKDAYKKGDEKGVKLILDLMEAIERDNVDRSEDVPRNAFVGAGKFMAENAPFMLKVGGLSLIPKVGPVLGFAYSEAQAEGKCFYDLLKDGCSVDLADKISVVDGCIEGTVEQFMGILKVTKGAVSKVTGKAVSQTVNDMLVQKAVGTIRRGGVTKVIADTAIRVAGQGIDEGLEEVIQDGTNLMARYIASAAEGYDLNITKEDVAQTLKESFAGGFAASLLFGAPATAIHVGTDVKDIRDLKAAAEAIPSKETFVSVVEAAEAQREKEGKNKIFAEMDETTKKDVIGNIWENVNKEKTKKNEKTAKELAEVYGAEDNMEVFADFDENGNEIEAQEIPAEYRTEEGRLYSTNTSTGENKGQFKIGDGSQENGKVYGYINYSIDEDSNTVTIENFKTTVERGNLRNEMFMEFAKDMSGYEIKWDPKGKFAKEIKENLVSLNPYGKKAGLSYFKIGENVSKQEQEDSYTRSKILSQIAQNMDVKAEERAPMLAVFEQIAKHNGMSVSDMFYGVFDGNVFGKISQNKTMKQADNVGAIRGGISIENVMGSIKATIYAAENADFSTWNHELAHLYRSMMQGDELAAAEKAFGVKDGNWTRQNEEDFAVGLEEYLRTGKVKSGALNEMFQKVVEFMARVYNGLKEGGLIKLSKEMEEFFDGIIESDNEVWAKAQEAVKNADENRSVEADVKSEQKAEAVKENKEIQPKKNVDETIAEGMNAKKKAAASIDVKTDTDVKAEDMQLSEENKEKLNTVKEDPQLSVEEKMAEGEKIAADQLQEDRAQSLRDGGNVLSDDDIMDLFQLVGPNGRARLAGELAREADEAAFKLAEEGKSNEEILAKTGRVFKDGRLWYDTKDGDFFDSIDLGNSINNLNKLMEEAFFAGGKIQDADFETAKTNALKMKNAAEGIEKQLTDLNSKYGTIGKLYNASAVYKAAPYLRNKKVEFECNAKDFHVSRIYDDKVIFNFFGVKDMANVMNELKNVLDEYIKADESGKTIPDNGITHLFLKEQINNPINKKIIQSIAGVKKVDLFQGDLTMYGIHNLSEDALRHALKMGGLANPSMAVVDTEKSNFTNFGDISLIPYNFMLEKGEGSKGTFGADIYSPRYPNINKTVTATGQKKVHNIFHAIEDENYKSQLEADLINKIENSSKQFDYAYSPLVMAYLAEKGNKDFYVYEKSKYSDEVKDLIKSLGASPNAMAEKDNKIILEAYVKDLKKDYEEQIKAKQEDLAAHPEYSIFNKNVRLKNIETLQEKLDIANETIKEMVDEKTGLLNGNIADNFLYSVKHEIESTGKVDKYATESKARELVKDDPEFLKWAKDAYDRIEKEEKIFNGYTPSGNRRYLAHTLENVSKYMRQQDLQGGEGFYYGLGSTRARFTPRFSTLKQIKKARDRLISHDEFEKIREEYNERFDKIVNELSGNFDFDVGAARFEEAFTEGKNDPIGYLEREYDLNLDEDTAKEILDFATALREMPTEYFETKYTRPVEINEFAGAIIPSNLPQDLKDTLANNGLMIEEYDREAGNREEVTKAALQKFNETRRVLFQAVFHGSPHIIRRPGGDVLRGEELGFDHSKMGSGEGAQAFGWGTYVTQVEGIAKNYASKLAGTPYTEEETERLARINEIHSAPSRLLISIDSKKDFLKSRRANLRDLDNGKYEARINKNIKEFTKELKAAQKQKNEDDIKFYEDLINTSIEDLNPKHKEDLRGKFQEDIDKTLVEIEDLKKQQKAAAKLLEKELPALQKEMEEIQSAAKERPAENVYTLDIPDEDKGNYISWNEPLSVEQFRAIFKQAKAENLERFVGYLIEDVVMNDDTFTPPTGEWLYKNDLKWDISSDKEKSLFLNRAGITGISYPAQYLSGGREDGAKNYVIFNENDIKVTDWHAKNSEGVDLFQTAYHGSGADFEKFDTENFGFSGEGSMSFGYGTYVTDNEEIARDYADRQVSQKYQNVDDPYNVLKTNIIATIIHDTEVKGFEKALKERIEFLQKRIENSQGFYTEEQVENSKKVLDEIKNYTEEDLKKRHLYTVEIPDDGYIVWDKPVRKQTADKIKRALFNEITTNPDSAYYNYYSKSDLMQELDSVFSYMEGQQLYRNVSAYLEGDEKASKFLRKIGYAGLKYPAGTIHGNGRDAYNYVIFNDEDAKITRHEYFQTQAELMEDAANEDSWENLRDYYSWALEDDENNVVPTDADNSYFMNIWEIAHNVSPTTAEREQMEIEARKKQDEYEAEVERRDPVTLDSIFMAELKAGKGRLETFLAAINEALSIDAEAMRADALDENEAAEADALIELQHRIRGELKHGTWISNVQRVAGGKGLTEETKKRMLTLIRNNVRQYRALYADIMNEPEFAVKKAENTDVVELAEAGVSYADMSIEERSKMAGKIRDERVKKQIEDGTLKMGMEFEHYIESLEAKEKKHAKDVETLRKEKEEEYNRITSKVERDILKKYEELQGIREEMEFKKIPIPKELDKGIAKAKGYTADRSALSQNYNRIWREYDDLLKSIEVTAKFKERLAKFDAYREAKKEMRIFREEKETAGKIRDLQKKLVTRTMRKVSFNNIDYDNARTIIAIQDILEPNLFAGVNRWLGVEKAWARDIWSGWKTDLNYREQVIRKLDQTETGRKLIELLGNTKTEQQFILWSDADKSRLERMMATKDWKKELKLLDLKKERAGAIQLDVTYKETKRNVYDSEGKWIGEEIFNVAEVSDELAGEIEEKIGTELFENIMHKPWEEWTIGEVEDLAKVIDDLYRDGRDVLKARRLAEKLASADMREKIAAQVATTNVVINDDDSDEVKKKKQKKINKILGVAAGIPGTSEAKARKDNVLNRLLHGYHDANVRRVARILDGWKEGTNTKLLYWKENDCYNRQERAKNARIGRVSMAMKEAGVKMEELFTKVKIDNWLDEDGKPHELTIDELLFFAQAERNNELYKDEQRKLGIDERDMKEESSYKAVVYGNLMNENEKEQYRKIDEDLVMQDEQRKALYDAAASAGDIEGMKQYARLDASKYDVYGNLILEGKAAMMATCKTRMEAIMSAYRNLDEKYKAVQDAIAQDYDTSFERMNRASIEEFNTPVWREKWYLPLIRLGVTGDTHEARVRADLLGNKAGTGAAGTEKGFTKKRQEIDEFYQRPVETGLYSTWADSVDRTEHFIAYSGYVRELNRVYMNRDAQGTMQNIKNRYGAQMTSYIQEYIKEVANPKNSTPKSGLDKVVRFLRGNAAPAYLGWKISGVAKQGVTSPMPFMQFVNPLEYAAAAKDFALNASDIREAINEKSVYMKNRKFDPIVDLIAEQKEKNSSSKIKAVRDEFNTKGMQGLEWIDYVCVAPGWLAVYRKENKRLNKMQEELFKKKFEELKSENEALSYDDQRSDAELETQARAETTDLIEELSVKKADDCTRLCQPSNRKVDLSPMFKDGGEIAKAVLQFQTSLNVIWQNIRYDIPYMVKNKMYKNIIGMVAGYTFAGIMLGLVTEGFDEDDDEAKKAKQMLYWSTTQYTDSVPLIGSAITDLANGVITGENGFYGDSSILVSFNKYKDAVMGYFAAGRKSDEADELEAAGQKKKAEKARKQADAKYRRAAMNFGNGIALNLGLPASGIKEIGRLFGVGDYDKDGEMDELTFNPGALLGRDPRKKEVEAEKKAEKEKKKKRK